MDLVMLSSPCATKGPTTQDSAPLLPCTASLVPNVYNEFSRLKYGFWLLLCLPLTACAALTMPSVSFLERVSYDQGIFSLLHKYG